jgi:WD40-like Beta Propeller Repeat
MRPETRTSYSLDRPHSGPSRAKRGKKTLSTSQGRGRDIKGSALGWFAIVIFTVLVAGLHDVAGQGRGVPGDIAFFSARNGNNDIYTMSWDGRTPFQITSDPGSDVDPAISPNGRDVTFTSNRTGNNDIYVMGITGGSAVNITDTTDQLNRRRWEPARKMIACRSAGSDNTT